MKKKVLSTALLILLLASNALADGENTVCTLKNDGFASKLEYYVDVYMVSTGTAFEVGTVFLALTYNTNVLSNPVLSLEHSDFHDNAYYNAMALDNSVTGETQLQITAKGATGTTLPATEIRLGRITFDIDVTTYPAETAGIAWVTAPIATYVRDISAISIFRGLFLDTLDGNSSLVCLPEISGTPGTTAEVGSGYMFTPTVSDTCSSGPMDFSIANLPAWAVFDTTTGELAGTPAFSNINTYSGIDITVTDAYGDGVSLAAFDIDVVCPPGPVLSGTPTTSITAGSSYSFTPTVTDGCGTLAFDITNQPSWASFDTATGILAGTPTLSDVGTTSSIVIGVTDQNGASDALAGFDIQVTAGCTAPVISGTPETGVVSGDTYSFTPTVSNGCGTLTFGIVNPPSWASFDTATGALTGTPDTAEAGLYTDIVISVTDELSASSSLAAFDIEVCNAPQLSGAPVTSITAGDSYSFTPTVTDGCGALIFSISNPPSWASFDTATGALTGTPTPSDVGTTSNIVISVTDQNSLSDTLAGFDIQVTAACTAPVISGTPDSSITAGTSYSFIPTVSNGCGTVTYSISNQPSWASLDTLTGALTGTPAPSDVGTTSNIVITATDQIGASVDLAGFDIEVVDAGSSSGATGTGSGGGGGSGGCFIATMW